jgi:hypothetical protein
MAKRKPLRTTRIYYGFDPNDGEHLYWTVPIDDAVKKVLINGTLADAMTGKPGLTIGCHLSNCALRNAEEFPHPVKFVAFTRRSCYVIDKIKNGKPAHAVRYKHYYSDWVDLNDKDQAKTVLNDHPEMAEREFVLHIPLKRSSKKTGPHVSARPTEHFPHIPSGALRRARDAGLIHADLPY